MGLLIFVTIFRLTSSETTVERVTPVPEPTRTFDFAVAERQEPKLVELPLELRDNTMPGDWSRTEDYELAATRGPLTLSLNNHFIVRNIDEAQVVASYTIEY
jgi:hypothetical protein